MSHATNANGPAAYTNVPVDAQPQQITAGGIVVVTAELASTKATFNGSTLVRRGPVPAVRGRHPHRAARCHHRHRR